MDAVRFIKEKMRMCRAAESCKSCQYGKATIEAEEHLCGDFEVRYSEKAVAVVEKWSKEHPVKTNEDKFEEVFGFGHTLIDKRDSWWTEPYEEPKEDA